MIDSVKQNKSEETTMLHETVLITWCDEKVEAEQCEPTLMCNIEEMGNDLWTIRLKDDTTKQIHVGQTESIVRVEEDDHHEFTMAFLFKRKDNMLNAIVNNMFLEFDKIVDFCPEDYETLSEQMNLLIEKRLKLYQEKQD